MFNPCICIDVSKNSSHIQGFIESSNTSVSKPIKIYHTKTGFDNIKILYDKLVSLTNLNPIIIFEYTGVYHKCLVSYLDSQKYNYHAVSPLKSAKYRNNSEIRNAKTDKRDCKNLANMFYDNKLGAFYKRNSFYVKLKELSSEYKTNKIHIQKLEVTLNELIDTIFPCFNIFSDLLSNLSLSFFEKYYHPELINNASINDIKSYFMNSKVKHTETYYNTLAEKIKIYASDIISGCNLESYTTIFLLDTIRQLKILIDIQKNIKDKLISLAKSCSNFDVIKSIPGVGDLSCAFLISELGDILRFNKPEQINAYLGIDPIICQSGIMNGMHLSISKKGNKAGRTILFLIVRSIIRKKVPNNSIKEFYYKKKAQQNVPPKVVLFACANKLIRIIYSLCKSGCIYEYSIPQK